MKEAEARAGEAVRGLREKTPILQVKGIDAEAVSGDWVPDLIARLLVDGRPHQLTCGEAVVERCQAQVNSEPRRCGQILGLPRR